MTLRVLVIDDERLPRQRLVDLVREHAGLKLVAEAEDGRTALDLILEHKPDLVFLDIQMPELDGFQVIEALEGESLPAVVFVTAYDEYAIRAFEIDAIDYLLKPVTAERFAAAVARVFGRVERREPRPDAPLRQVASRASGERHARTMRFVARRGAKHYFVPVRDVVWIEAVGNYVRLDTGDRTHLIRETMKGVEAKLDPAEFLRIHRSAIVAVEGIESIEPREQGEFLVTLRGGMRLVSSRAYANQVRRLFRQGGVG